MIPVKLTIQGLYSYQFKQTIDFTQLTAAHLFGIFGAVGSGKSSILEAITFALYGKTDRLNLSGDNRNYNMMNLKSDELVIDFEFETGKNQTAYRAVVKGRRNSKRFEDVKTLDRSAYIKERDSWVPVECMDLEEAIGLSYENFKRTIIIPQGQFQEFLQLGNRDRTKMMKELFNLDKFELYYKVVSVESKNNEQKQNIQGQLQQLGEIDPEQIKIIEEQLVLLKTEIEGFGEQLKVQQHKETQWQQIQEVAKKLELAKQELAKLKEQEPWFIRQEEIIQQYENCVHLFKAIIDSLQISNSRIAVKTKQIEDDLLQLQKQKAAITEKEHLLAEIKPDFEKRDQLKQRAEELEKLSKIKILDQQIEAGNERLRKGNSIWKETAESVEKMKADKVKLEQAIKKIKSDMPDLRLLSNIKSWHLEKKNLEKLFAEKNDECSKLKKIETEAQEKVRELFSHSLFTDFQGEKLLTGAAPFLKKKTAQTKQKLKVLEQEAGPIQVKLELEKYAKALQDGSPCPVCGSVHHPEIYSAETIQHEQQRLEKAKQELEKLLEEIALTENNCRDLESQLNFNAAQLSERRQKMEELQQKTSDHDSVFEWEEFKDYALVEEAFKTAFNLQQEIGEKEPELEKLNSSLNTAEQNKERYQIEIDKIKTELTVRQTEARTLREQLKAVTPEEYSGKSPVEIDAEKKALLQKYDWLEKQCNLLNDQLAKLRKTKDNLEGSITANQKELEQEKVTHAELNARLEKQMKQSDFNSVDEVKQILTGLPEVDKHKKELAEFRKNFALAGSRVEELQKEMGARIYDQEAHQKVKDEITRISEKVNHQNQEYGKMSVLLKKLKDDLQKQATLRGRDGKA